MEANKSFDSPLLTPTEAAAYLRLDEAGSKNFSATLRYYRQAGKLHATRLGRKLFYSKKELNKFIEILTK